MTSVATETQAEVNMLTENAQVQPPSSTIVAASPEKQKLTEKNEKLRGQIEQLEDELRLTAEIGKQLLDNNHDLTQQLETTTKDYTSRIETLEQELHMVQLRLDQKVNENRALSEEFEYVKTKYESQRKDFEMKEQNDHLTIVNQLKKQVGGLQSEVETSNLMVTQLEQKNKEAEELAESLQRELTEKMNTLNETSSEEMAQLHSEVGSLNAEKRELTSQLSDSKRETEQLRLSLSRAKTELSDREAEVEEHQCQATGYFNALERSREEVQELKVELDMIRMETQDQKKKGNSLFGELEDRRVDAEKKVISLKVQNDTLKKQYNMTKENLNKLKLQMATLLQMSTGRADSRHLSRLQQQLDEARSEVADLNRKLAEHKRIESSMEGVAAWQQLLQQDGKEDYANFVKALMKNKDEEVARLERELTSLRLQDMARSQQVMDQERQIYSMEQEKERLLGITMKQKLRIDELQIKYEPDKHRNPQRPTIKAEKIPPRIQPTENKENQPKPEPRPLEAPSHIKAALHQEVLKETLPSDKATIDQDVTLEQTLANMSVATDVKPVKAVDRLRNKSAKKVTLSPEVEIKEIESENTEEEGKEPSQSQLFGRVPRGKLVVGKTVKVKAAQPQGEDGAECKVQ